MEHQTLTKRQREILEYVKSFSYDHGYAPSYREIGEHFGLSSTATVAEHIKSLSNKGYLNQNDKEARSLTIVEDPLSSVSCIPLLGSIAAGSPVEAIRTNETVDIPQDMVGHDTYALKVRGNSMEEDYIVDGDYVIIEPTTYVKDGDIVAAMLEDGTVTLKRFYKENGIIRLQPANSSMQPIFVKKVTIQGKVKGVIRRFGWSGI